VQAHHQLWHRIRKYFLTSGNEHHNTSQEMFTQHKTYDKWEEAASHFTGSVNLRINYLECFALALSVSFMYVGNLYVCFPDFAVMYVESLLQSLGIFRYSVIK
jgi:hypothetical protein